MLAFREIHISASINKVGLGHGPARVHSQPVSAFCSRGRGRRQRTRPAGGLPSWPSSLLPPPHRPGRSAKCPRDRRGSVSAAEHQQGTGGGTGRKTPDGKGASCRPEGSLSVTSSSHQAGEGKGVRRKALPRGGRGADDQSDTHSSGTPGRQGLPCGSEGICYVLESF